MRTIGRRWPVGIGPDRQAICSYCGAQWRRSQLRRDASGNLACPDEGPGLDIVSLSEGNARLMRSQAPRDPGPNDGAYDRFVCPPDPGFVDPNRAPPPTPTLGPTGQLSVRVSLWVRSDNVVIEDADRVRRLVDLSGGGNDLVALTDAERPIRTATDATLNGLSTLRSFAATKRMRNSMTGGSPLWGWVIRKMTFQTGGSLLDAGVRLRQSATPGSVQLLAGSSTTAENAGAGFGVWARDMLEFNLTTMALAVKRVVTGPSPSGGQALTSGITLFSRFDGTEKTDLDFAELLLTDGPPTAEEIADIEAYGVARYGGGLFA